MIASYVSDRGSVAGLFIKVRIALNRGKCPKKTSREVRLISDYESYSARVTHACLVSGP